MEMLNILTCCSILESRMRVFVRREHGTAGGKHGVHDRPWQETCEERADMPSFSIEYWEFLTQYLEDSIVDERPLGQMKPKTI